MPTRRRAGRSGPGAPARRRRSIVVRRAGPQDTELLVRHRAGMWRAIGRGTPAQRRVHDRTYRRWILELRETGRFVAFVASDRRGRPLGSGAIWLMPSQPRPDPRPRPVSPYILSMYTEPGARGSGVATAIVRAMIAWCRSQRFVRVTLHASKMGRGVYERLGFQATNELRLDLRRTTRRRS